MKKILVTGGCGYIGSHTIVDLVESGYEVISVDNNARSSARILEGIEKITGKKVKNYKVDLCNFDDTFAIFQENEDIAGIIHFAAFKAVGESVEQPLMYFENNLVSLINLLKCVQEFHIAYFVFFIFVHRIRQSGRNPCYRINAPQTRGISLRVYQTNGRADN